MSEHPPNEEITTSKAGQTAQPSRKLVIGIVAGVLVLAAVLTAAIYGLMQNAETTAQIRDIFIIFLAFESLIIGAAMVILVIQLASLINLLQNEVRPILDAASETIHTLRGTTEFLSENVVEPVIKLNGYLASLQRALELLGLKKR
jgi:hypothetical protein